MNKTMLNKLIQFDGLEINRLNLKLQEVQAMNDELNRENKALKDRISQILVMSNKGISGVLKPSELKENTSEALPDTMEKASSMLYDFPVRII
jgi:signal transduction histidine kinase